MTQGSYLKITMSSDESEYEVITKTGSHSGSSTDSTIRIQLVGTNGETGFKKLNHLLHDDFEKGNVDKFRVKDKDVGEIEYIVIKLKPSNSSDNFWYVEYIKVSKKGIDGEIVFPIYSWIYENEGITIYTNKTCLPQDESETRKWNNHRQHQTLADRIEWISLEGKHDQLGEKFYDRAPGYLKGWVKDMRPGEAHAELDKNIQFTDDKDHCFNANRKVALKTTVTKGIKHMLTMKQKYKYDTIDDYLAAAKKLKDSFWLDRFIKSSWLEDENITGHNIHDTTSNGPKYLQNPKITHWSHDAEFGRQMLNGINPHVIRKCKKGEIPSNFPIGNNDVMGLLPRGTTLEKEIKDGNIYIINHKILEGVSTGIHPIGKKLGKGGTKMQLASPICLLHHNTEENTLKPIAIQLQQFSKDQYGNKTKIPVPIWTPKDFNPCQDVYDWLYAKMWFRHADFQVHQMKSHLCLTHLLIEPIAVATFRCLPPVHPIHKLLREHIQFVIAINTYGRESLIAKGGAADRVLTIGHGSDGITEILAKSMEEFRFNYDWDFKKNVDERDVHNLPNYFAKDDGLALWKAIKKYVRDVVNFFYFRDNDVKQDEELGSWIKEINEKGLHYNRGNGLGFGTPEGLYEKLDSKKNLIDIVTKTIYQSSVAHAQVNFLQFEYGCFAPNVPAIMRGKIPKEENRGKITMDIVMDSLPGFRSSLVQAGAAFTLSEFSTDEVFLLPKTEHTKTSTHELVMSSYHSCPRCHGSDSHAKCCQRSSCCKPRDPNNYVFSDSEIYCPNSTGHSDCSGEGNNFFPPRWLFTEKPVEIAYNKFIRELRKIQGNIIDRRKKGITTYEVLLPSRIPYGIAI